MIDTNKIADMLHLLEWTMTDTGEEYCLVCDADRVGNDNHHEPGCELQEMLDALELATAEGEVRNESEV